MKAIDAIIGVGWIVFWAYWLVMAFTAKAEQTRWSRYAGVRVGLILVILVLIRLRVFRGPGAATGNPWLLGIGLAVFVLGLALAVWARVYLGGNWGMPMSRRADPELVTTGPYRWIRHPIYSGILLGLAGGMAAWRAQATNLPEDLPKGAEEDDSTLLRQPFYGPHQAGVVTPQPAAALMASFDVLAEVVCEDDDHLLEILGRVRAVSCVRSTETFVYLKLRKQTYSWGTR